MPGTLLVIPCYNEEARLPVQGFLDFAARQPDTVFLFVDDGSTDRTRDLIENLRTRQPTSFRSMALDHNRGKAEAVRAGMLKGLETGPDYIGFWDADLSTPLDECPRIIEIYRSMPDKIMLSGARVKLMGREIERRVARHYLGRVFATAVSILLGIDMYDTQCGAKLFRCLPTTRGLFEQPFHSRWLFDLELILRVRHQGAVSGDDPVSSGIYEVPLNHWRDVAGSKVSYGYFLWAVFDLLALRLRYRVNGIRPN